MVREWWRGKRFWRPFNDRSSFLLLLPDSIFDDLENFTNSLFRHKNKKLKSVPGWSFDPEKLGISDLRPHHLTPSQIASYLHQPEPVLINE